METSSLWQPDFQLVWTVVWKYYTQGLMKAPSFIRNSLIVAKKSYALIGLKITEKFLILIRFFFKFSTYSIEFLCFSIRIFQIRFEFLYP